MAEFRFVGKGGKGMTLKQLSELLLPSGPFGRQMFGKLHTMQVSKRQTTPCEPTGLPVELPAFDPLAPEKCLASRKIGEEAGDWFCLKKTPKNRSGLLWVSF